MKKKIGILCFSALLLFGCSYNKDVTYKLKTGDKMLTVSEDYIIVDSLYAVGIFGEAEWRSVRTISRTDTTACNKLFKELIK